MRVSIFTLISMTLLGLMLIAYGTFMLLKTNAEFRETVFSYLSKDQQVKLSGLINQNLDFGGRIQKLNEIDDEFAPVCTGTSDDPAKCKDHNGNHEGHNH